MISRAIKVPYTWDIENDGNCSMKAVIDISDKITSAAIVTRFDVGCKPIQPLLTWVNGQGMWTSP